LPFSVNRVGHDALSHRRARVPACRSLKVLDESFAAAANLPLLVF